MYGIDITDVGKREIKGMEVIKNKVARVVPGANRYVAVEALRREMGWISFEVRVNKTKMKYQVGFIDENR